MTMVRWAILIMVATVSFLVVAAEGVSAKVESAKRPADKYLEENFKKISPHEMTENPIRLIGGDWMLITAGNEEKFNSMTASWGGWGIWNTPVTFIFVHSDRYTYQFLEREEYYTLTFFDPNKYRGVLKDIFGTKSGRDTDKVKESGLTPLWTGECFSYQEARMIIVCKKRFSVFTGQPNKSHKQYTGDILSIWVKR